MASGMYNLGVFFKAKDGVTPSLKRMSQSADKTSAKMFALGTNMRRAFGGSGAGLRMGGLIGASTALYGVSRGIKSIITESSRFEVANLQFSKLIGNADLARETLLEMELFASRTPFQFKQSQDISKGLLAANVSAKNLIPTMRMLGDLGMGDPEKVSQLAYSYAKVRNLRKANMRDINMFATAGIPIFDALAKQTGKSISQLRGHIRKGKITFEVMKSTLENLADTKFKGMMLAMMGTLTGLWSNLGDSVDMVKRRIGKGFSPGLKAINIQLTALANRMAEWLDSSPKLFDNLNESLFAFAEVLKNVDVEKLAMGFKSLLKWGSRLLRLFIVFSIVKSIILGISAVMQILGAIAMITGAQISFAFWPVTLVLAAIIASIMLINWLLTKMTGTNLLGDLAGDMKLRLMPNMDEMKDVYNLNDEDMAEISKHSSGSQGSTTTESTSNIVIKAEKGTIASTSGSMEGVTFADYDLGSNLIQGGLR